MKIEIWSDVVCPFCYIGKRKLEKALEKFPHGDEIEIEWKSFQLNPDQETNPNLSTLEYLSQSKGWSMEETLEITANVVNMAAAQGLKFDFDKAVVANTKKAHRLIHLAKTSGKGGEMKELLLEAYFSKGQNVDDSATLISLGQKVGLEASAIQAMLESDAYEYAVNQDIYESRQLGVRGIPFFVLDRKFGISGAQSDDVFDQTLEKAWNEYTQSKPASDLSPTSQGESCDVDGNCR